MQIGTTAPRMGRRMRRPVHNHHLRARAFQIQPFMIAPVLAGETMKNLLLQSRVVTDQIKNPFIGWWKEYYYFYVKLTDLDYYANASQSRPGGSSTGADIGARVKMLLGDPAFLSTDNDVGTAYTYFYNVALSQDYIVNAYELCVRHYFRDEADLNSTTINGALDGLYVAGVTNSGLLDSTILNDNYYPALSTVDVDLLGDATDATLTVSEIDNALKRYELARANGLTDATYEEYLNSFGITQPAAEVYPHRPELLRYVRQWSYPANTVEPTTGVPSSAVSWSIQERADKDRFFKEPGFIIGMTVARPKVYLSGQTSYGAGWLDRAEDWMPAWLWSEDLSSMKKYAQGTGPFAGLTDADGYWVDMKDLFMYGDQFVNFALSETDAGLVALPTAALEKKYVVDADVDALFSSPTTKQFVREDGVTQLTIASQLRDTTPTV